MEEIRNPYKILVKKTEGKSNWKTVYVTVLFKWILKNVEWINLAEDERTMAGSCEQDNVN
jgi:hypothetical protein